MYSPAITRTFDATTDSGDNTLIAITADERLVMWKAYISVDANVTGNTILKVGSTGVGKIRNAIVGGNHVIYKNDNGETFPLGDDLVLTTGDANDVTVTVEYAVINGNR